MLPPSMSQKGAVPTEGQDLLGTTGDGGSVSSWYLIRSKVRSEPLALSNLERQGFDAYCPTADGQVMFPGYLFVCVHGEDMSPINSTIGVIQIVRFGEQLATVPDPVIEAIKRTEWQLPEEMPEGSKVHIRSGPFRDMQAILKAKRGDRVVLLLNIINREQEITLNSRDVEPA